MRNKVLLIFCYAICTVITALAQFPNEVFVVESGSGDGSSWANALGNIQTAVNTASDGGTVWVSNGVYTLGAEIKVGRGITVKGLYGTNDPALETVVNGGGATRCFWVTNATLDGLVISNGYADYAAGVYVNIGTVQHCRLTDNIANNAQLWKSGGAMMLTNACLVSNCVFNYNQVVGGVCGGSALTLYHPDCVVADSLMAANYNDIAGPLAGTAMIYPGGGVLRSCIIAWNTNKTPASVVRVYDHSLTVSAQVLDCLISSNSYVDIDANVPTALYIQNGALASNCTIVANSPARGVVMSGASVLLKSIVRDHQEVMHGGAGVWMNGENTLVDGCVIENNTVAASAPNGARGGGMYCVGGTLINSTIRNNQYKQTGSTRGGAGLAVYSIPAIISNCYIIGNESLNMAGGIYAEAPGTLITHSVISSNIAINNPDKNQLAGGIYSVGATIRNCLIAGNKALAYGGGIRTDATSTVESCTIVANEVTKTIDSLGGGLACYNAGDRIYNTIIYDNSNASAYTGRSNWYNNAAAVYSNCCSTEAPGYSLPGNDNVIADPLFINAEDYRLAPSSPCINTGLYQDWMADGRDLDGRARLDRFSRLPDIGCYEYMLRGVMFKFY